MNKQNNPLDERQRQINFKALAVSAIFLMICISASMIYKVIVTEALGWEFWALIGASLVIIISRNLMGDIKEPTDIFGKPLPTGNTKQEKNARKKDYALQSIIFAAACAVMDIILVTAGKNDVADYELAEILFPSLNKPLTVAVTAVIAFVTMLAISYLAEYLIGERYKVKRYNQMLSSLEEDE